MNTLVKLLADGKFHSGEELGKHLKVTRAAIWKKIKKLTQQTNLSIHSVTGKGYRLSMPLSLLDADRLSQHITQWPITLLPEVNSTNTECFRLLQLGATPPFSITAEHQTTGKGRRGRLWVSPYGQNIYYSLLIPLNGAQQIEGLSLTIGLAILNTLKAMGLKQIGLKWPNDILLNNKKICGILLELHGDPAGDCHVVIGIGINVNMPKTEQPIDQPWTSIYQELGDIIDRNELLINLNQSLHHYLALHCNLGFKALQEEWQNNNLWQNQEVTLVQGNTQTTGKMLGIDETGALKLMTNNGIQCFNAGEVSLRLTPFKKNQPLL